MKRIYRLFVMFALVLMVSVLLVPEAESMAATKSKKKTVDLTLEEFNKGITYKDVDGLKEGDSITYRTKYDLNGDGTEETITETYEREYIDFELENGKDPSTFKLYKASIKVNGKLVYSGEADEYDFIYANIFDLNPGDSKKEVMIVCSSDVWWEYIIYRYTGTKMKKLHYFLCNKGDVYENQKANDYLQCRYLTNISEIGFVFIEAALKSKTDALVLHKNNVYKTDNDHEYEFCCKINLYKTVNGKTVADTLKKGDKGVITKERIDPETETVTHVFVKCTNGKQGWIKLKEKDQWGIGEYGYIVNNPVIYG